MNEVDLSKLAMDKSTVVGPRGQPRRRYWISRYLVPGVVLLGFVTLLGATAGRQFLPQVTVSVVPVIVKRGEVQQAGTPLFQAAGWIEPRPTAVSIAALAPGVIEELLVVEGQVVTKDEPIARLIDADARFAVARAKTALSIRESELLRVTAEQKAAVARFNNPVHLQAQLADATSLLAKAVTELDGLPYLIRAAEASEKFTRVSLDGKRSAEGAVAGVIVSRAEKDHTAALAELEELKQRGPNLTQEVEALRSKVNALQAQLDLLVEERRQVEEANAMLLSGAALRDEAELRLQQAELNLDRTVVRSPLDGRILRLVASPGTRVMGLEHNAGQSSSTVAEMYDPRRLQIRADVRLEDVPLVTPGAPVRIETASSGTPIEGRVLQPTSSANIQKNTLEVKVELIDPPTAVRPEMLVTATFLAPKRPKGNDDRVQVERVFAPKQLVQSSELDRVVWIVDADSRATRKTVEVGSVEEDGLIEITKGLNAMDKLIASGTDGLRDGALVIIGGEDLTMGVGR